MCTKPRPHAELIKAWADGAVIQYQLKSGAWEDTALNRPSWHVSETYRIKPEPTDIEKYGVEVGDVWLLRDGSYFGNVFIMSTDEGNFICGTSISVSRRVQATIISEDRLVFRRGVVNKFEV